MKLLLGLACLFLFGPLVVAVPIEHGFLDFSCQPFILGEPNIVASFNTGLVNGSFSEVNNFTCSNVFPSGYGSLPLSFGGTNAPNPDPPRNATWSIEGCGGFNPEFPESPSILCGWGVSVSFNQALPSAFGREHGDLITITGPATVLAGLQTWEQSGLTIRYDYGTGQGTGTLQLMVWDPGHSFTVVSGHFEFGTVPEPATAATMLLGLAGLGALTLRRSNH